MSLMLIVCEASYTDRIVLKLSKLEFKSTRRKKIDFGNELTVLCISQIEASTSPIPLAIPRAFDVLSRPGGREFD